MDKNISINLHFVAVVIFLVWNDSHPYNHVVPRVWSVERPLHCFPAIRALCSYSHCFIFVCLLSCFLLLSSWMFLANCFCLVALSFFAASYFSCKPSSCHLFFSLLLFLTLPFCHFPPSSLFAVVPPPPFVIVFPFPHLPLPPGGYGWTAGAAAVPPQYVQHAVPTLRPTRLWDPPHLPSTFTFSFTPAPLGPPGGKPQSVNVTVKGTSLILTNTVRHCPSSHGPDAGRF